MSLLLNKNFGRDVTLWTYGWVGLIKMFNVKFLAFENSFYQFVVVTFNNSVPDADITL